MKCLVCGSDNFVLFHHGCRDNPEIDVMKCQNCGQLQLSLFPSDVEKLYSENGMHKKTYNEIKDKVTDMSWEDWCKVTETDDKRRFNALKEICKDKSVLDFGCGNGGFLRNVKAVASSVSGTEYDSQTKIHNELLGITIKKDLDEYDEKFDVITMFMVLEHLEEPKKILNKIYSKLNVGGVFICETPNSEDALISRYHSKAFLDFTFWSMHVSLYNSANFEEIICNSGFKTIISTQVQRYPLSNHLYWLAMGKPGGHKKYVEYNDMELNQKYADILKNGGKCDTLWGIFRK